MAFASDKIYVPYLQMGRIWPQLRGPLAITVLEAAKNGLHNPWSMFDDEVLSSVQLNRTIKSATNLHNRYGIKARLLTSSMAQLEWRRALSAACYLVTCFIEVQEHRRYDPYFDYLIEARKNKIFSETKLSHEESIIPMFAAISSINTILTSELILASVFQASYMPDSERRTWLRNNKLPKSDSRNQFLSEPVEFRRTIVCDLRDRMISEFGGAAGKFCMAASMGIDWKIYETQPE